MTSEPSFAQIQTETAWGRTLASFADWIAPQPGWMALDVGGGPGLLAVLLAQRGCRACGVDIEAYPAAERLHPHHVRGEVLRLPFSGGTFDLVCASNLLFFLPDPTAALVEMRRVLKIGAALALLNPSERMSVASAEALANARGLSGLNRDTLLGWAARAERHHRWDETGLRRMLHTAGFELNATELKIGTGLARFALAHAKKDPADGNSYLAG